MTTEATNVQFGCGLSCPDGWINFDASPTVRLQRLPVVGGVFRGRGFAYFPEKVKFGDVTAGLPVADGAADRVYCSHVLEHLSLADFRLALAEVRRILKPGGIFRLVLPDLELQIREYTESNERDRAKRFLVDTHFGVEKRNRGFSGFLRDWLGGSRHLWMWDFASMTDELKAAGFTHIRRAAFGDSNDPHFALVEDAGRWTRSLGVECSR